MIWFCFQRLHNLPATSCWLRALHSKHVRLQLGMQLWWIFWRHAQNVSRFNSRRPEEM